MGFLHCWRAKPISDGYGRFGKVPFGLGSAYINATTHDEHYVRDAAFKISPCPRDIIHYIRSPISKMQELDGAIHNMDPSVIANTLRTASSLRPHVGSHKVLLFTRVGPVATTAIIDDPYVITLKSDYIYDKMLEWADLLNEAEREKWYSLCRRMGAPGGGLAGFLFEDHAVRYTCMCFPLPTTTTRSVISLE